MSVNGLPGAHNAGLQPIDSKGCHTRRTRHTKVLFVSKGVLANGRGRWLAIAASLVVSAAILYAQGAEHTCCRETPAAIPTGPDSAPANAPRIASPRKRTCWRQARLSLPSNSSSRYLLALRRKRVAGQDDLGSPCRLCAISSDHQHLWL